MIYIKSIYWLIVLTSADVISIWLFVLLFDPDKSSALLLVLFLIPVTFLFNLVVGGVLLYKKKRIGLLFIINSLIASVLMWYIYIDGMERNDKKRFDRWEFNTNNKIYEIEIVKEKNEFYIKEDDRGFYSIIYSGKCYSDNNNIFLKADSAEMRIVEGKLIGFGNYKDTIELFKR